VRTSAENWKWGLEETRIRTLLSEGVNGRHSVAASKTTEGSDKVEDGGNKREKWGKSGVFWAGGVLTYHNGKRSAVRGAGGGEGRVR